MNAVLWIAASLLALLFLGSGASKILQSKEKVVAMTGGWAEDFSPAALKFIGAVEVLGALGVVLPAVLDIATVLVPLTATGLAVQMVLAAVVHGRRAETKNVAVNVVLLLLAAFVAWGRFGPHSF
jgi:hypothetical protein